MREGQPAEQSAQFCIGNSPRARGGQPGTGAKIHKIEKFSPHARGSTLCHCAKTDKRGFSPHARGSTLPDCNIPQRNAILPACAGVNPVPRLHWRAIQDSPRMRGGATQCFNDAWFIAIILPACARVNPPNNRHSFSIGNSPCMRGGQPRTPSPFEGDIGFSPHARGSPFRASGSTSQSIHPACAGVNPFYRLAFRWC